LPDGGRTVPSSVYGFSTVLMSIASPNACIDQVFGPLETAARQLNADVLSAAIDLLSSPPYAAIGTICRIGKRAA